MIVFSFAREADARAPGLAGSINFFTHNPSAELLCQSLSVAFGVFALERVFAPPEFAEINCPIGFHAHFPLALAMQSRAKLTSSSSAIG